MTYNGFTVIEWDSFPITIINTNASEVMILNIFAYRLTMFYSCSNNREYITNDISYSADMISLLKGSKARNSVKYVGGVTILALCKLSDCV